MLPFDRFETLEGKGQYAILIFNYLALELFVFDF